MIRAVAEQTDGLFHADDFMPLPCAHPNCHSLAYAYRRDGQVTPLTRFIDARNHLDLLANGITFDRVRARQLIEDYLGKNGCCSGGTCGEPDVHAIGMNGNGHATVNLDVAGKTDADKTAADQTAMAGAEFFRRALGEDLSPADVFRITITSFLDAYNFDVRRVMKCCIHHVLPSGHVIPFCAYNVLYRDGHVPLPEIKRAVQVALEK